MEMREQIFQMTTARLKKFAGIVKYAG